MTIPFPSLASKVELHTGQLLVVAGGAGGGKSLFATNFAYRSPDPILYIVQEDAASIRARMSGLALSRAARDLRPEDADYWAERLDDADKGTTIFAEGAHTPEMIEANIVAFTEYATEPPRLIILDNLRDTQVEGSNSQQNDFYAVLLPALKQMAWKYDVAFMLLHHVQKSDGGSKDYGDGLTPLTMMSLLFGGERDAAHVWGVYGYKGHPAKLYLQILKQRDGQADPSGYDRVVFDWDQDRGIIYSR